MSNSRQYHVTGMSCAACSNRVEKAVTQVQGVTSCAVSLLTNSMSVEGSASDDAVIKAVTAAGYGASLKGAEVNQSNISSDEEMLEDKETPVLIRRLLSSVGFLVVLMYFSMGYGMWQWPVPIFFEENYMAIGMLEMILAAIVMIINKKFFISGFNSFIHKAPNMDTLVAMGSMASFIWSVIQLFMMTDVLKTGASFAAMHYYHNLYFESAAMILTLITVGKMLEAKSKGRTTDAIKNLMRLAPQTACVVRDGAEMIVPIAEVRVGDIFVVRPGENIPVDGIIVEGNTAVNESALTGESIPVDKKTGDAVSAATINSSNYIKCEATRVGNDTTLSQIIKMVSDAATTKAPIAKIADKVSGVFVPTVLIISLVTFFAWMILGEDVGYSLGRSISVLVISCPCALGLATPVAIMVGNGMGAKNGILFKTAASLEETGKIQYVALDKTGTITKGEPQVTDVFVSDTISKNELLKVAVSLENCSDHPLARAIVDYGKTNGIDPVGVQDSREYAGNGMTASFEGAKIKLGNRSFVESTIMMSDQEIEQYNLFTSQGKSAVIVIKDDHIIGIIAIADVIKEDSAGAIKELQGMGIQVVMITGDNERTANVIGNMVGVDKVISGVRPEGKDAEIRKLMKKGKVAMVGDGINDAPALTRAHIGIAIGAGTDIAIDAAEIVLMKSSLMDVPAAIRLSRQTLKNIRENLFWAFFYNIICIPLAAGCYVRFGITLNPMIGAAAMSLSSFCVITNALRLNLFNIRDKSKDKKRIIKEKEENKTMEKTMKIEGMMCMHCEAAVKKALEALEQVETADVSHEKGTAVVTLKSDVENDVLKNAVEAKDYKVTDIQ